MQTVQQMLVQLIGAGMSQADIAAEVGVSQPTIHRAIKKASGVSYEVGKRIEVLHATTVQKRAA